MLKLLIIEGTLVPDNFLQPSVPTPIAPGWEFDTTTRPGQTLAAVLFPPHIDNYQAVVVSTAVLEATKKEIQREAAEANVSMIIMDPAAFDEEALLEFLSQISD